MGLSADDLATEQLKQQMEQMQNGQMGNTLDGKFKRRFQGLI